MQHRLIEKLHEVHICNWLHAKKERRVCAIDQASKEFMTHAKKVCRKIKCCRIPYSPEASIWIRRAQAYYLLLRYRKGGIKNVGNLKQVARRCNISNPLGLSAGKIDARVEECKRECKFYQKHGKQFQAQHLTTWLHLAQVRANEETVGKIVAIIQREKQRSF